MKKNNDFTSFGYSEADITPDWPVELVGFSRIDNTSKGILHQLKAQILVCKSDDEACCLITIDSIGFTVALTNHLRDLAAKELGVSRQKIMVCFSHTHSAPNAGTDHKYYTFASTRILSCVRKAASELSPLHAAWGVTDCEIGINRRGHQTAVDKRLGVLKLADSADQTRLLLLRVTAHANVLTSDNYHISSDYFGVTRDLLEQKLGCKVLMVQGAAGDIRPKFRQKNAEYLEVHGLEASAKPYSLEDKQKFYLQSMEALDKMAQAVSLSVDRILGKIKAVPIFQLSMFSEQGTFRADIPSMEKARKIAYEAGKEAGIDGTGWLSEIERLHREKITVQEGNVEIQYFVLNEGCLCGIANEAMCEIALDIQAQTDNPLFFFNGYVNGIDSYLPTAKEYDNGGYEVLWSNLIYYRYYRRVMPFNRNTARELAHIAADTWLNTQSQKPLLYLPEYGTMDQ
ncbi:hypothetical protein [Clostridium sp. Marseille-P2415]|uniref:hypothetical protein n=1 Tax=Clostridium sp. Marseille-P2415 TaxID=1805471 RepID=UPI00098881E6|nr:hypothetical protein [Clostridium sp. Marseille-P2415]